MQRFTQFCVRVVQSYLPDAYILAILLTFIVFFAGMALGEKGPVEMINFWGKGFSSLFVFGMQMALVLLTGYVLALTPIIRRILSRITDIPKNPNQALGITAIVSLVACYFNWGFGLVIGAILAKEMGKKVRGLHFPLLVAAAYGGEIVRGPSSSIPLVAATKGNFMEALIGVVPVSQTLYSWWNLLLTGFIFVLLFLVYLKMRPPEGNIVEFVDNSNETVTKEKEKSEMSFAERLEHTWLINGVFALFPLIYLISNFQKLGFNLDLNLVILIFLTFGLFFHSHPASFLGAVKEAITACRGIIVQFPLYAGMSGMMTSSGLVDIISIWFVNVANANTFPLMTFLSAGLVNIFIPSGGGQWAIQGPIVMTAAEALGADKAQTIMAFAWGDAWTNQIQPFWALPLLGVAGLSARDIMGYCIIWTLVSGITIASVFVALSFM